MYFKAYRLDFCVPKGEVIELGIPKFFRYYFLPFLSLFFIAFIAFLVRFITFGKIFE